jgi:hypothetical protein
MGKFFEIAYTKFCTQVQFDTLGRAWKAGLCMGEALAPP